MNKEKVLAAIKKKRLVAIIRLGKEGDITKITRALLDGGINILEVTSNTPDYLEKIETLSTLFNKELIIGAGTVTNLTIAKAAITAGAQFLVTPNTNVEVIQYANKLAIPILVGAMTPTEICTAVEAGADLIKLFPAGGLGINYFKAIKGPLDNVPFFVVGGINTTTAREWLNAGVDGIGIGSSLVSAAKMNKQKNIKDLRMKATEWVALLQN